MRQFLSIIVLLILSSYSFAQDCPIRDNQESIKEHKIHFISVKVNSITELKGVDSLEVIKIEFNKEGNVLKEKTYKLFDVILYGQEFDYEYNSSGQLVKKIEIQTDYPRSKADTALINSDDYASKTTRWTYHYDSKGKLIHEYEFNGVSLLPRHHTEFLYDIKGQRIKAIFQSVKYPKQTSYFNKTERYSYDEFSNRTGLIMNLTNVDYGTTETFTFNEEGNVLTEFYIDSDEDKMRVEYLYDSNGLKKIINEQNFLGIKSKYVTTFQYSKTGFLIQEVKETELEESREKTIKTFDYENGLLKSEYGYSKEGKRAYSFKTEYTNY